MTREGGDAVTREAVAETALENETAREGERPGGCDAERGCSTALLEHLPRSQRRITVAEHAMMLRGSLDAVVQQVAFQGFNPRVFIHLKRFVYVRALPAPALAIEKPELVIWIPTAAANPAIHIKGTTRKTIAVGKLRLIRVEQIFERGAELVRDAFISIEAENPLVLGFVNSELFLRGKAGPCAIDDARPALRRDLACVVS